MFCQDLIAAVGQELSREVFYILLGQKLLIHLRKNIFLLFSCCSGHDPACQNQQDCPCARQDFFQSFFHLNFSLSFYFS